jgi:TPR repeat protein
MIADSINNDCGMIAKFSFRAAKRIIDIQCQHGRIYPSRFSLKMLQYSADHGHVSAMSQLGSLLYNCGVGRAVKRSGLEYIRMAAKGGDTDAQFQLGKAYFQGSLTHQDSKAASHWLALAADRGHQEAATILQSCLQQVEFHSQQEAAAH